MILVADDNAAVRGLIVAVLKAHGYTTIEAGNGKEAVDAYYSHHLAIDLVLTDLEMPVMDGLDALGRMRALNPALASVVITGAAHDAAWPSEIVRYWMPKPLVPGKLLELVRLLTVQSRPVPPSCPCSGAPPFA
jgi:two-component system, cell cycle sensor histidine kinase and response regulator CckA